MPRELHCAADTWRSLCDSRERLATWIGGVTEAERNRQVRAGSATGRGVELVLQSIQTLLTGSEAQFRPRVRIPPDPLGHACGEQSGTVHPVVLRDYCRFDSCWPYYERRR